MANSTNFFKLVREFQNNIHWLNQVLLGDNDKTVVIDGVKKPSVSKDLQDKFNVLDALIKEIWNELDSDIQDKWAAISAIVHGGRIVFETKDALLASGQPPADVLLAEVWRDVAENNGLYGWMGSAWEKSDWDNVQHVEDDLKEVANREDFNDCGYAWAVVDRNNHILIGLTEEGALVSKDVQDINGELKKVEDNLYAVGDSIKNINKDIQTVESDVQHVEDDLKEIANREDFNDCGYAWAVVDKDYNIIGGFDSKGVFRANIAKEGFPEQLKQILDGFLDLGSATIHNLDDLPIAYAVVDANNRILMSIDDEGTMNTQSTNVAGLRTFKDVSLGAGYAWAISDANDNVLLAVTDKGKVVGDFSGVSVDTGSFIKRSMSAAEHHLYYTEFDSNQVLQVVHQSKVTSEVKKITTSSIHNLDLKTDPDGSVIYQRNNVFYYQKPGEFIEKLILPEIKFVCWGDSMTGGACGNPEPWRVLLSDETGIPHINEGIGGQKSQEIAARCGGRAINITVTDNTIPASGAVACTSVNQAPMTSQGYGQLKGWLGGIYGTLSRDRSSGGYTFTRAVAGEVVSFTGGIFVPDKIEEQKGIQIYWLGHNNTHQTADILEDIQSCIEQQSSLYPKFVVMTVAVQNSSDSLEEMNNEIMSRYPHNAIDVRKALVDSYDPSKQEEVEHYQQNRIPPSMRCDSIHLSPAGYEVVKDEIIKFMKNKEWI